MQEIQLKQVQRATVMFDALGIKYKLIAPDGQEFGDLEVVTPKVRTRQPNKYPHGEVRSWYGAYIDLNAKVASVQVVPFGVYQPEEVRNGVTAWLSKQWGNGNYTTHVGKTGVEVMRLA